MKLEAFFEKFDELADAPDSVTKLRQLVLELAVQGRLVPQDSREASAVEELAELDLGTPELVPRFEIPANWVLAPLEPLLLMMKNGYSGKPNKLNGHYKVTRIETIARGTIDMSRVGFADELPPEVVEKHVIRNGDILFSHINSEPHLGKTAICTFDDPTLIHGVNLLLLRTKPQIDPQFLNTAFKELRVSGYFASIAQRAINQSSINQKNLRKTLIPIPPLAEQKRIVVMVNELMALCDRLEAQQLERKTRHAALARASLARFANSPTPANLTFLFHPTYAIPPADLSNSILTLAVQGKLVPQDPNDEPAEELLWNILGERERLVKTRQIRRLQVPPLDEEDEPFPIPETWVWTRLGTIGDWGSGSTPPRGNHELYGGRITWLKSGELNDNQALAGSSETVTELALKTCSFRQNKPGDVLIAMYGATIGKLAILAEEAVTNQAVCGCTPFPGILNTFLFYYLLSRRDAFHAASEGGAQPNISKIKIVNSPFPLPPLSEQRRIVAKLEQLMALVGKLEAQLDASVATGANLLSALVAEISR